MEWRGIQCTRARRGKKNRHDISFVKKGVNIVKLVKKVLAAICSTLMLIGCTLPTVAVGVAQDNELTPVTMTGGMGGVVMYDTATGEETYIPVESYYRRTENQSTSNMQNQNFVPMAIPVPRTVTPPDLRTKVQNNTSEQYQSVVLLKINYSGATAIGTGFVVDSKHIVTAGHCLYQAGYGWATSIDVYRGASNGSYTGSKLTNNGGKMWVGGDYKANIDNYSVAVHDDWGVFEVSTTMSTPAFTITPANAASDVTPWAYTTAGYPDDLDNAGISDGTKRWMYSAPGSFMEEIPRPRFAPLLYMNIDAAGGQSGSPIYRYISGRGYIVQGILVAGDSYQTRVLLINDFISDFVSSL